MRPPSFEPPPIAAPTTQMPPAAGSHSEPAAAVSGPSRACESKRQRRRVANATRTNRSLRRGSPVYTGLIELGAAAYQPDDCVETSHFRRRAGERNITPAELREAFRFGLWSADQDDESAFQIARGRLRFVVAFRDEELRLVTCKFVAEHLSV